MGTAKNLLQVLKDVNVDTITDRCIRNTSEDYADLNAAQLAAGKRADGTDTGPYYTPVTVAIKRALGVGLGSVTDRVTLYDKGDFYRGIRTVIRGDMVATDSFDDKADSLKEKYGDIFGLNERYKQEYIDSFLRAEWKGQMENETGLKLML